MHPAMQRRRHRLLIRRTTQRRSPRRGLVTLAAVAVAVFILFIGGTAVGTGAGLLTAYNYFATGCHLHFGVLFDGGAVNPRRYLP